MRKDMAKVIVERPRWGSSLPSMKKGYLKTLQRTPIEEQLVREPMLGRWHGRNRMLNEHLGSMHRFLRSNVGRPWNKVHQELCEYVSFENAVQSHVLDHIFDFVERDVVIIDGQPAYACGRLWGMKFREGQMYVCPKTGLLKEAKCRPTARFPQRLNQSPELMYLFRDGSWWEVRVRKVTEAALELWDIWLERDVSKLTRSDSISAYGEELFAVSKRALSRQETRQLLRRHRNCQKQKQKKHARFC